MSKEKHVVIVGGGMPAKLSAALAATLASHKPEIIENINSCGCGFKTIDNIKPSRGKGKKRKDWMY